MESPGYRLRIPDHLVLLIRRLHPGIKRKVRAALRFILDDPASGKPLRAELEGLRSYRVGRFRIVYRRSALGRIVELVAVGPRDTIYRETLRLIRR